MYVLRRSADRPSHSARWLKLHSLDQLGVGVGLEWSDELPGAAGEVFEIMVETRGHWRGRVNYATCSDWIVTSEDGRVAFEELRRSLFSLRVRHIGTFHTGFLLRRVNDHGRYTVLGLYGDRAGLDLARRHPAIRAWRLANAEAERGARDTTGLGFFAVAGGAGDFVGRAPGKPPHR